jgi:Cu/Ag efflux protein CusF
VSVTRDANGATVQGVAKVTATIVGIDPATRTVTLKTQAGKVIELEVTNEARNFDQLALGDVVTTQYRESLTLSLVDKKTQPSRSENDTAERAPRGAKPGGELGREVTVIADVIAVDRQAKIVTLRGPRGQIVDLHVQDPERLKRVKKGDQVKAVYTEALAISVEPATTK